MDAESDQFERKLIRTDGGTVEPSAVVEFFSGQPWSVVDDRGDSVFVCYSNDDTGVRFYLVWSEQDERGDLPFLRRTAGLTFHMALARPGFFALEAMPILVDFCRHLNLRIVRDAASPDAETLIDQWRAENRRTIHKTAGKAPRLSVPRVKSLEWWQYQRKRAALEKEGVRENVFVPSILVLKEKLRLDVFFAVAWTQAIPIVLPPVDHIIVDRASPKPRKKPRLFRISYAQVVDALGEWLEPFEGPVPGLRILREKNRAAALKIFNTLPVVPADNCSGLSFKFIPATANFIDSEDQHEK